MEVTPNIPRVCGAQESVIQRHGDEIWDYICATKTGKGWFRVGEVVPAIVEMFGWKPRTAQDYIRVVLHNVLGNQGDHVCLERAAPNWRLPNVTY